MAKNSGKHRFKSFCSGLVLGSFGILSLLNNSNARTIKVDKEFSKQNQANGIAAAPFFLDGCPSIIGDFTKARMIADSFCQALGYDRVGYFYAFYPSPLKRNGFVRTLSEPRKYTRVKDVVSILPFTSRNCLVLQLDECVTESAEPIGSEDVLE